MTDNRSFNMRNLIETIDMFEWADNIKAFQAAILWIDDNPDETVWWVWISAMGPIMLECKGEQYYAVVCAEDGKSYKVPSIWVFVDHIRGIERNYWSGTNGD